MNRRKLGKSLEVSDMGFGCMWMLCKKPWIVPIPGTRKKERMIENAGAAEIILTEKEVSDIDSLLGSIEMSEVFGGHSAIK